MDFSFNPQLPNNQTYNWITPAEFIGENFNQTTCMTMIQSADSRSLSAYITYACSSWFQIWTWTILISNRAAPRTELFYGTPCRSKLTTLEVWMHFGAISETQPDKRIITETSWNSEYVRGRLKITNKTDLITSVWSFQFL